MNRRKGVPCGCDADPCGCSPKNHCVKAINNVSPDPNGDFNIKAGAGISISQTGDDEITIVNAATPSAYVAGTNIEFTPSGADTEIGVVDDPVIDGTLTVNGDIIQNGAAYETHAEKVYTTNDYIIMRDGAVGGLAVGDYAGFQVEKYDGTNDGRLVIDRDGVARVGDVGDEQPLLTREESANLNNGALLKWDSANQKAVDEGTVGSDTKPIKIVNGVATAVTDDLAVNSAVVHKTGNETIGGQKTFSSYPIRIEDSQNFADWSKFYVNNTYMGTDLYSGVDINNYGGIRIVWDDSQKKVSIQAIKVANGVFSGVEIINL